MTVRESYVNWLREGGTTKKRAKAFAESLTYEDILFINLQDKTERRYIEMAYAESMIPIWGDSNKYVYDVFVKVERTDKILSVRGLLADYLLQRGYVPSREKYAKQIVIREIQAYLTGTMCDMGETLSSGVRNIGESFKIEKALEASKHS